MIPLGKVGGFSFPYFTKPNLFTKEYLINKLLNIPEAKLYLPDSVKLKSLSREFLINVSIIILCLGIRGCFCNRIFKCI